jgi:hypothetical protein
MPSYWSSGARDILLFPFLRLTGIKKYLSIFTTPLYIKMDLLLLFPIIIFIIPLIAGHPTERPRYTYQYNLPEYSEYKKIIESLRPTTTATTATHKPPQEQPLINHLTPQFVPDLPLCKETPENSNLYGHAYCLIAFLFYLVAIVSALLFTCRAFGCLKRFERQQQQEEQRVQLPYERQLEGLVARYPSIFTKDMSLEEFNKKLSTPNIDVPDGHSTNYKNSSFKPADKTLI